MNAEAFFQLLGDISPEKVSEAMEAKRPSPVRLQWGALAACLVMVVALASSGVIALKGGILQDAGPLRALSPFQFNGAIYEIPDMKLDTSILDTFCLPRRITEDMVGEFVGTGTEIGIADPQNARIFALYQYIPYADIHSIGPNGEQRPQRAVYVADTADGYAFALFCNYLHIDSDSHEEADELFAVYGIDEAEDIASITVRDHHTLNTISDPETIRRFYDAMRGGLAMGNDSFQREIMHGLDELGQQEDYRELADSAVYFSLTTRDGLVTSRLTWRPTIGYIEWALNYYQLNEINR